MDQQQRDVTTVRCVICETEFEVTGQFVQNYELPRVHAEAHLHCDFGWTVNPPAPRTEGEA